LLPPKQPRGKAWTHAYLGPQFTDAEIAGRHPSSERRFLVDWLGDEAGAACHAQVRRWYAELHGGCHLDLRYPSPAGPP